MSVSPGISLVPYRSSEHFKTRIMVFAFNLFVFSSKMRKKVEVDIPKAVLIFLPIVFSHAGRSAAALDLLRAGSFSFNPQLRSDFPQENWDQLFSASYKACKLAIATEGDNIAIASEGDNLYIALEGASDNTTDSERDNFAITAEGDKPTIPDAEIGTSSRGSGLEWLLQVVRIILELILGTFYIHL